MPKDRKKEESRRRRRHRSCSEEDRLLEIRLANMQKQLDDISRREHEVQEPYNLSPARDSELYNTSSADLSSYHRPHDDECLDDDKLEAGDAASQIQSNEPGLVPNDSADQEITNSELQANILQILGFEPTQTETQGPPIHSAIKPRWIDILCSGLNDDVKSDILKKYLIPVNLSELKAPLLNPEVKVALSPQVLRRDDRLVCKQGQLSSCITGLGQALTLMLSKVGEKTTQDLQLIECLSDTGRLLCDYFHSELKVRKDLILLNLNKDLRDVLAEAPVSTNSFLFGDSLEDRLKTAKNLEKAALELRQSKSRVIKSQPAASTSLNLKSPSRVPSGTRGGHVQVRSSYQQRPVYSPYQRPSNPQRLFLQNSRGRRPPLTNQDLVRRRQGKPKAENNRQRQ